MHCSFIFSYELQKSNWLQISAIHILIHFNSFYSILIINITDSINIEYTSLKRLESKVQNVLSSFLPIIHHVSIHLHGKYRMSFLPSFLSSIMYQSISMACNLRTFNSYSFNRSWFINTNHSNSILFMNCIQSVIMPKNHACKTTVYQSLYTTIDSYGIHSKLQSFLQILVIPVAIINSILHATQNKTFTRKWI